MTVGKILRLNAAGACAGVRSTCTTAIKAGYAKRVGSELGVAYRTSALVAVISFVDVAFEAVTRTGSAESGSGGSEASQTGEG